MSSLTYRPSGKIMRAIRRTLLQEVDPFSRMAAPSSLDPCFSCHGYRGTGHRSDCLYARAVPPDHRRGERQAQASIEHSRTHRRSDGSLVHEDTATRNDRIAQTYPVLDYEPGGNR